MKNKFKLVETEDYLLAVSDEDASNSYIYFTGNPTGIFKTGIKYKSGNGNYFYQDAITGMSDTYLTTISKKIIGYQPKGNAPELDLPLLPDVEDDTVEKLAESYYTEIRLAERTAFKFGYKAATKVYSEEDIDNAYIQGSVDAETGGNKRTLRLRYLESLKQPKTPKWFVAETVCDQCLDDETVDSCYCNFGNYKTVLKNTTINGKTYLVGTYLN
jgi:hypothetical protein